MKNCSEISNNCDNMIALFNKAFIMNNIVPSFMSLRTVFCWDDTDPGLSFQQEVLSYRFTCCSLMNAYICLI